MVSVSIFFQTCQFWGSSIEGRADFQKICGRHITSDLQVLLSLKAKTPPRSRCAG